MSVIRPHACRFLPLLLLAGSLALGPGRPAQASQEYEFSQVFSLSDVRLASIDAFGSYWSFSGNLLLETLVYFDDYGNVYARVYAYTYSRGLNYHRGTSARMEIWFSKWVECFYDPVDGQLTAKVLFPMMLWGAGGGELPVRFRLILRPEGVSVRQTEIGDRAFD